MRISDWSSDVCSSDLFTGTGFDDRLNFAAGLTYFRETGFDQSRTNLFNATFAAGPTVPPEFVGRTSWSNFSGTLDNDSYGLYAQANYKLTDKLSLTGRVRFSLADTGLPPQSGKSADTTDLFFNLNRK